MPYVVGIVLSLSVALFARRVGFDRDRAFYPTVLIVIASYYVLFAAMSESVRTVLLESMVMAGFSMAAVVGFKSSGWIVLPSPTGNQPSAPERLDSVEADCRPLEWAERANRAADGQRDNRYVVNEQGADKRS